jgi:hypothetical protein
VTLSLNCGHKWACRSSPIWYMMSMESLWNDTVILTEGNQRTCRKTCLSATLSTTISTWTDPGVHGERLVNNHLRHGCLSSYFVYIPWLELWLLSDIGTSCIIWVQSMFYLRRETNFKLWNINFLA